MNPSTCCQFFILGQLEREIQLFSFLWSVKIHICTSFMKWRLSICSSIAKNEQEFGCLLDPPPQ